MIGYLDNLLRHLFLSRIDELTDESQVRFQPPDDDWVAYVSNLTVDGEPVNALNVYLTEIRENALLRSTQRTMKTVDGLTSETAAPRRLDCHYFISAWSPAENTGAVEPTIDEHELLYETTAVLMQTGSLTPENVYAPDPVPPGFPDAIARADLPMTAASSAGFPKIPEFWGTVSQPWRPGIHLVVTLPVLYQPMVKGPLVTTRIAKFRQMDSLETFDTIIAIGGAVLDTTVLDSEGKPTPMPETVVQLWDNSGNRLQETITDTTGRFVFGGLRAGNYELIARVAGRGETMLAVTVPAPDGMYDLMVA